jgi:1-acyl-sn-glycerol-3-phosphate acyltransferase
MFSLLQFKRRAPGLSAWQILFWWGLMIWLLQVAFVALYRVKYHGRGLIPRSGPLLFVANHQSNFDPPIVGTLVQDRPFKGIAKEGLFKSKILSAYIRGFGAISIKRGESDMTAIRKAIDELSAGRCVMLFPEGSRSKDGEVAEFQRGFWLLMKKSKATIIPVGLDGAFEAYPIGSKPKLRGRIEVTAGKPIEAEMLLELGEKEGTVFVRNRIIELHQQCKANIARRLKKN